ncbi:MAG: ABC transporter ATP-binding protein [Acidimicrobiaceae bacterium]|jgi:branched-chain amino acid transport system ATP-binding protein|nr:ABC transporter ATP-binding protein [Acidimicrobiaceae bacterium]HAY50947.1 ABC transporter ATP-binding protein [Acidimicrobiaceae bacterium]|tara:strand:- start:886 stop:1596 length:711 start_codon:yes stop_codon:yes gene_type:complete
MAPLLLVESLKARYGPVQVLHGIDLNVFDKEIVVVLGANGAGKTTTLRSISGMVETDGRIEINGQSIKKLDPSEIVRRGVAHVPQGRGTFPELTVEENLKVGAFIRSDNDINIDIEACYQNYPVLYERRTQTAGSLSGGEQQMLAVSRALMSRPQLLLMDEPSLGLAPQIVEDLFTRFVTINEEHGTTMLIVEQNAQLALDIANRAYVLESGEITIEGQASELANDDAIRQAYLGA